MTDLGGGYTLRPIPLDGYRAACARLEGQIFGGTWGYAFGPPTLSAPPLGETFTWGISHGEEVVGWQYSHRTDERTVSMADTGILPAHQGQGLYSRLLPHVLDAFRTAGYTLVQSHHRATNNRVIIPKLRAGFLVQGLNLYEGGVNVALTLSLDAAYRDAMHVRSGFAQAHGDTARRLGVSALPQPPAPPVPVIPLPDDASAGVDLGGEYTLHAVPEATYRAVYAQLEAAVYDTVSFEWPHAGRHAPPDVPQYAWLVAHGGHVVGWQSSRQWNARTAYMTNTAFLPAHRGRGLYTRLLPVILAFLRGQGYDLVRSAHHATNTAVLLPKLRAGFRLQGLEIGDHGVMAVLIHSFDDVYREYMDVRSGLKRPTGEVARRLGLDGG
ncbi:GNAT superfamily N-acetyltransferase [Deinococcus metalli]|uniref:Acetyltransferase n=1 Tax=Deinococcus metalli TaxID=1141878 RepID=A0A7W8NP13_9DEIO|nr:GNAT family N-acetyltransferase [Deinococcus metalli]MBB5376326.1 GNAT superfamily N-acetyltransferase [Deinococcus metalli]GHF39122.1 acetyltransferase [Deinococcus metalli]